MKTFEPGIAGIAHEATGFGDRSTYWTTISMKCPQPDCIIESVV